MSDSKPTYVARYIEKFLAQTFLMDAETVGAMVLLEAFAWIQEPPCTLPMDDKSLERYAKVAPGRWSVIGPQLMATFYEAQDGRWFNPDLFDDYQRSLCRMKVNRENGAKGGLAKGKNSDRLAIGKQPPSDGLASTPSEALAIDRDRDRDREIDSEKDKEKSPPTPRKRGNRVPLSYTIPESLNRGGFPEAFTNWIEYRKQIKKPLAQQTCDTQLKNFAKWGAARSVAAIEHTIGKGYQGLLEPDAPGLKYKASAPAPMPTFGAKPVTQLVTRYGEPD